jgi:hypothetical protein
MRALVSPTLTKIGFKSLKRPFNLCQADRWNMGSQCSGSSRNSKFFSWTKWAIMVASQYMGLSFPTGHLREVAFQYVPHSWHRSLKTGHVRLASALIAVIKSFPKSFFWNSVLGKAFSPGGTGVLPHFLEPKPYIWSLWFPPHLVARKCKTKFEAQWQ